MKKNIIALAAVMFGMTAQAQDTYQNANIATSDLNGTAKYVGMGGAMEALGGDISTISSNPAGIGLFRHSWIGATAGLVIDGSGATDKMGESSTNASFDQAGFVLCMGSKDSFVNFGFNYSKSRNFNQILNAAASLGGLGSQNMGVYNKELQYEDRRINDVSISHLDIVLDGGLNRHDFLDKDGNVYDYVYYYAPASGYNFGQAQWGFISNYDFNLSGNINNRVFLGMTVGIKDVHYNSYSEYTEELLANGVSIGDVTVQDDRTIRGSGVDFNFGMIFRPIESSPFRIGVNVATPTMYSLKTDNYTFLKNGSEMGDYDGYKSEGNYEFEMHTPWRFGVSLGHTISNYFALGATYEFASYSSLDNRVVDKSYNTNYFYNHFYDDYGSDTSISDREMNKHTKQSLKGVSTFKIGAEVKPTDMISVRVGYNYVSPMYKDNAYKDVYLNSYGVECSSQTAWINWGATNRITLGLGFKLGKANLDIAYQYKTQSGTFYPFASEAPAGSNDYVKVQTAGADVKNERHQLMASLGYTF